MTKTVLKLSGCLAGQYILYLFYFNINIIALHSHAIEKRSQIISGIPDSDWSNKKRTTLLNVFK